MFSNIAAKFSIYFIDCLLTDFDSSGKEQVSPVVRRLFVSILMYCYI